MTVLRRLPLGFACAISVVVLGGCTSAPVVDLSPSPTPDAMSIAEDTLDAYVQVTTAVGMDVGEKPERLTAIATGDELAQLESAAESWRDLQIEWVGERSDTVETAEFDGDSIVMLYCFDSTDYGPQNVNGGDVGFEHGLRQFSATLVKTDDAWVFSTRQVTGDPCRTQPVEG